MSVTPPCAALDRRTFLTAALLGAGSVCLASCGDSENSDPGAGMHSGSADTNIRVVGDGYDVTVPSTPSRVVVMEGRGDLDFALTGQYPIVATGSTAAPGQLPAGQYTGLLDSAVRVLGGAAGPSIEDVAAQAPDLIIMRANGYRRDFYGNERLSQLAPILPVEVNEPDFVEQSRRQFDLVGRSHQLQTLLDEYNHVVVGSRDELGNALVGRTAVFMTSQPIEKGYVNVWTHQLGTTVANDLGLDVIGYDPSDEDGEFELSTENLVDVGTAEYVFHQTTDPDAAIRVPTWTALRAHNEGRTFAADPLLNNGLAITATAVALRIAACVRSTLT